MDPTKPIGKIKPQILSTSPYPIQNVLFDDPIAIFDDPIALFGALSSPIYGLGTSINDNAPVVSINPRR